MYAIKKLWLDLQESYSFTWCFKIKIDIGVVTLVIFVVTFMKKCYLFKNRYLLKLYLFDVFWLINKYGDF